MRGLAVALKIAIIPLSLALLSDGDVPLYFVVISATAYLGLCDTGVFQSAHTHFSVLAVSNRPALTPEYLGVKNDMRRRSWFILALLLGVGAMCAAYYREAPDLSMFYVMVAVAVMVLNMPLRTSVPLCYALRKETAVVGCELAGQLAAIVPLVVLHFIGGKGATPLGWVLMLGFGSQYVSYYMLDRFSVKVLPGIAQTAAAVPAVHLGERLRLFGCSVGESLLMYGDTLIFAAILSPQLAAKVGLMNSVWLQMLLVSNIMLIRIWTDAASQKMTPQSQRPKFRVEPVLLFSVLTIGAGGGLVLPFVAEPWTQGRITVEFAESLALASYYLVSVASSAISFRMKGLGLVGDRIRILAIVGIARVGFV